MNLQHGGKAALAYAAQAKDMNIYYSYSLQGWKDILIMGTWKQAEVKSFYIFFTESLHHHRVLVQDIKSHWHSSAVHIQTDEERWRETLQGQNINFTKQEEQKIKRGKQQQVKQTISRDLGFLYFFLMSWWSWMILFKLNSKRGRGCYSENWIYQPHISLQDDIKTHRYIEYSVRQNYDTCKEVVFFQFHDFENHLLFLIKENIKKLKYDNNSKTVSHSFGEISSRRYEHTRLSIKRVEQPQRPGLI